MNSIDGLLGNISEFVKWGSVVAIGSWCLTFRVAMLCLLFSVFVVVIRRILVGNIFMKVNGIYF